MGPAAFPAPRSDRPSRPSHRELLVNGHTQRLCSPHTPALQYETPAAHLTNRSLRPDDEQRTEGRAPCAWRGSLACISLQQLHAPLLRRHGLSFGEPSACPATDRPVAPRHYSYRLHRPSPQPTARHAPSTHFLCWRIARHPDKVVPLQEQKGLRPLRKTIACFRSSFRARPHIPNTAGARCWMRAIRWAMQLIEMDESLSSTI